MIGKWIKESRKAKGLSQEKLAEIMYTSKQNIRHYESGNRDNPTLNTLRDFSRALDLNILIEQGEVIKMNKETGLAQTIEMVRERLEQQFQYTDRIPVGEMVTQVMNLIKNEFEVDFIGWRGFLPDVPVEIENPEEEDWTMFFGQTCWGRFEFEIELNEGSYVQGVTFEMENPTRFAELMMPHLPQTKLEWDDFSDVFFWADVVNRALNASFVEIGDLIISDIQIEPY